MEKEFKIEDNQLIKIEQIKFDIDSIINEKNMLLNHIDNLNIEIDKLNILINKAIELGYNGKIS